MSRPVLLLPLLAVIARTRGTAGARDRGLPRLRGLKLREVYSAWAEAAAPALAAVDYA